MIIIFSSSNGKRNREILSRLLLIEFVALTDSSCDERTKNGGNSNAGTPNFNPKEKDGLTESIMYTYLNSRNVNPLFFKFYADDLEFFFDGKDRKKMSGGERWKHNSRFFNRKMWHAWEWMLKLLKDDQTKHDAQKMQSPLELQGRKPKTRTGQWLKMNFPNLTQKWNGLKKNYNGEVTHKMLRTDHNENLTGFTM